LKKYKEGGLGREKPRMDDPGASSSSSTVPKLDLKKRATKGDESSSSSEDESMEEKYKKGLGKGGSDQKRAKPSTPRKGVEGLTVEEVAARLREGITPRGISAINSFSSGLRKTLGIF
jgi:hypothetical protein